MVYEFVGGGNTASFELLLVATTESRFLLSEVVLLVFPIADRPEPTGKHIKDGIVLSPLDILDDVLVFALGVPITEGKSTTVEGLATAGWGRIVGISGMGLNCTLDWENSALTLGNCCLVLMPMRADLMSVKFLPLAMSSAVNPSRVATEIEVNGQSKRAIKES